MRNGQPTTLYLQTDLVNEIETFLSQHPTIFKSRNHLLNAAFSHFIRCPEAKKLLEKDKLE